MPGPEAAYVPVTWMAGGAGSATPWSSAPITWASPGMLRTCPKIWQSAGVARALLAGQTDWSRLTITLCQQSSWSGDGKHGDPSMACVAGDFHPPSRREGRADAVLQLPCNWRDRWMSSSAAFYLPKGPRTSGLPGKLQSKLLCFHSQKAARGSQWET